MDNKDTITLFAKTNFRNREVPFGIKTDDRRRHMYVIGKTGMGKTTLMENMVIQDIRNGHGVAFLDPHGDSVQRILDSVPSSRVNDVIYFNPADMEYPVAFNILESVDPKYKHLVASGLMGVFTKIWANLWSARMEYILNNTILALLDSPGNTLLGITRMYVDKKYRKKIVDNIKDPMVRAFWVDEFANYNEKYRTEAIAPIQNKVGQFLSSGIIRNIVGQPKSTIDLREIMDERKILIMDLSKGKVGEDNSALLGAMIVTKLQLAALSRADVPEKDRKDFYLYVDEFQNFATQSFATILSEARKYRLNLIVGHQYIAQLEQDKNTIVRDAIFGNVGTIIVFRVGAADAEFMETEFDPIFTPNDLVNLPKYNIILKLMINGVASEPFSAVTLSPNPDYVTNNGEKVIKVSRERYSNPVAEIEEKISRWMGAEFHQEAASLVIAGQPEQQPMNVEHLDQSIHTDKQVIVNVPSAKEQVIEAEAVNVPPPPPIPKPKIELPVAPKLAPVLEQTYTPEPRRENYSRTSNQQNNRERENSRDTMPQKRDSRPRSQSRSRPPHRQEQKKENPIWNTVATIQNQKAQVEKQKISETVKILEKDAISDAKTTNQKESQIRQAAPVTNINHNQNNSTVKEEKIKADPFYQVLSPKQEENHEKVVLKPGQAHKF